MSRSRDVRELLSRYFETARAGGRGHRRSASPTDSPWRAGQARRLPGPDAAPLLEQAAATFQELRAAPALDRVLRLRDERAPQDAINA